MAYCSTDDVRRVSGLSHNKISDQQLIDLRDNVATPELNEEINRTIEDERVQTINGEKENNIDGSNTTFYLREVHMSKVEVGDRNDDGDVTDADVAGYFIDGDDTRNDIQVTLQDAKIGKVDVTDTNSDPLDNVDDLYLHYEVAPLSEEDPNPLIKTACAQLTAAYAFTNIEASKLKDFSVGNVDINQRTEGYGTLRDKYRETVNRIVQREVIRHGRNKRRINPFTHGRETTDDEFKDRIV